MASKKRKNKRKQKSKQKCARAETQAGNQHQEPDQHQHQDQDQEPPCKRPRKEPRIVLQVTSGLFGDPTAHDDAGAAPGSLSDRIRALLGQVDDADMVILVGDTSAQAAVELARAVSHDGPGGCVKIIAAHQVVFKISGAEDFLGSIVSVQHLRVTLLQQGKRVKATVLMATIKASTQQEVAAAVNLVALAYTLPADPGWTEMDVLHMLRAARANSYEGARTLLYPRLRQQPLQRWAPDALRLLADSLQQVVLPDRDSEVPGAADMVAAVVALFREHALERMLQPQHERATAEACLALWQQLPADLAKNVLGSPQLRVVSEATALLAALRWGDGQAGQAAGPAARLDMLLQVRLLRLSLWWQRQLLLGAGGCVRPLLQQLLTPEGRRHDLLRVFVERDDGVRADLIRASAELTAWDSEREQALGAMAPVVPVLELAQQAQELEAALADAAAGPVGTKPLGESVSVYYNGLFLTMQLLVKRYNNQARAPRLSALVQVELTSPVWSADQPVVVGNRAILEELGRVEVEGREVAQNHEYGGQCQPGVLGEPSRRTTVVAREKLAADATAEELKASAGKLLDKLVADGSTAVVVRVSLLQAAEG